MISLEFIKKAKLPMILLAILVLPQFFGSYVPLEVKTYSYAASLSMKSILEFFLPFIIFSFIFSCLENFQKGAVLFVLLLIFCVFISNFSALLFGFGSAKIGLSLLNFTPAVINQTTELIPAWHFSLKKLISNDFALVCGFICGIFFSIVPSQRARQAGAFLNKSANAFLKKIFIPLLPVFVLGFVFKLEYENTLRTCLVVYGPILILIVTSQWLYILNGYLAASNYSFKTFITYLKNVFPATLTGFSTLSSAASMPVLLISTEKNLGNPEKADTIVPAIINIHTIGSAIAIPIVSLATMINFNIPVPTFSAFVIFALYTALAKFAVAAVPGGVVIVVAPILEAHLGFSPEMIGIITAVYMICDPFGTAANVTANGVFPILFDRIYEKSLNIKKRLFGQLKQDNKLPVKPSN